MTPDDAFLAAIMERPDDDAPRLVYADWLEDNGQPERAEFIRTQCELEKAPPGHLPPPVLDRRGRTRDTVRDPRRRKLARRAASLLRRYGKRWAGPVRGLVGTYEFRRGFVEAVALDAARFVAHAGELFRLAPVRHAWLTDADCHLPALLRAPGLSRLAGLDLSWNYFHLGRPGDWTGLLTSPRLRRLKVLRLEVPRGGGPLPPSTFRALLATTHFKQLVELDLMSQEMRDRHVKALAGWPCLATVARLDPTGNTFGEAGARALARSPYLKRLAELNLSYTCLDDAGWRALLASPNLANLTWLGIEDAWWSDEVERALRERFGEEKLDRDAGY